MRVFKVATLIITTIVTFIAVSVWLFSPVSSKNGMAIPQDEIELIVTLQSEGKDPMEIAETLTAYEDEKTHILYAESVSYGDFPISAFLWWRHLCSIR